MRPTHGISVTPAAGKWMIFVISYRGANGPQQARKMTVELRGRRVPAYVFSSYVAMSRLPANRHWASDVVFGSAVGIISGRTVTGHELSKYNVQLVPIPGGIVVTYAHHAP